MRDLKAKPDKKPRLTIENDEIRIISHDGAEQVIASIVFQGRLSPMQISYYCGALLHDRMIDVPLVPEEMAQVLHKASIPVGIIPAVPIIKMMKSEHADMLTNAGQLRLGSIDYYRRHENSEVQDRAEGHVVLAAFDGQKTHIRETRGGLNDRLFCCYAGMVDWEVIRLFGYDAAVEITNVKAFADAIQKTIRASESSFSSCIYVRDRALYGEVSQPIDPQQMMDGGFSDLLGQARAFLKHNSYRHQAEFRLLWRAMGHLKDSVDITCPELTKLCKRIPIPK